MVPYNFLMIEIRRWKIIAAVAGLALFAAACSQQPAQTIETAPPRAAADSSASAVAPAEAHDPSAPHHDVPGIAPHQDHDAKHGGTYFMAVNEKHHLEGVLITPGTFRVYLYDEYNRALPKQDVAKADAKVIWGGQENAPELPLKISADGMWIGVGAPSVAGAKIQFPVTLTLLIRFPGAAPGSRPELFTFPFTRFTHDPTNHTH